jgi:HNH endonuclease
MPKKIQLTNGMVATVDNRDYELVSKFKWCYAGKYVTTTTHPQIRMHELIMGKAPKGFQRDHWDRDRFNNRRKNLRLATDNQNKQNVGKHSHNTSGYKGVHWNGRYRKPWLMQISIGKHHTRGIQRFNSPIEAALSYDFYAKKYHGAFAVLNFPDGHVRFPRPHRFPRKEEE